MLRDFEALIIDARKTAERMRADARHLKELGRRAGIGARLAGQAARKKLDQGLEKVADAILDLEARAERVRNGRRE